MAIHFGSSARVWVDGVELSGVRPRRRRNKQLVHVDDATHTAAKDFCEARGENMTRWVSDLVRDAAARANCEHVLLGVRGSPKRMSASVHQVIEAPRREHSAKPPEVRERIVQLMGDVPRIELFAREAAPGWSRWGLEAPAGDGLVTL